MAIHLYRMLTLRMRAATVSASHIPTSYGRANFPFIFVLGADKQF